MKDSLRLPAVLAFLVTVTASLSAQDGVEDVLRRGHELPLRWDNIERAPEWLSGQEPQHDLWERRHTVVLEPGQSTCVRVPSYELLRIFRDGEQLAPDQVEVALSTGSGLLAFTQPIPGVEGKSLLVDPGRPYAMLAHVMRPTHFDSPIRVSLFTSRHVPLREVASHRDLIELGASDKVRLTTSVSADSLAFWRWKRGARTRLTLRGPARFLLETRYRYPSHEQKLSQTYHIGVHDEDNQLPLATVEYATSHETAHFVCVDGEAQVVSRLEPGFFELPEDRVYDVTLETSAPVFIRLLRMEEPDYLLPPLNAPDPQAGEVARDLRPQRFQASPWEMPEERLFDTLTNPLTLPADQVERAAMLLARDNRRRDGGMMASALLWNAGAPRRDYPDIRERWREFAGFRTHYRDALPEGDCLGALRRSYFPARRLQELGKARDWLVLGEQHLDAGLSRLPLATFAPLQGAGAVTTYRFPDRATHSIVRIAAEREEIRDRPADFWVRVPGEMPRRFRLLPLPEVPWEGTEPTQGEAALTLIEGDTLDAPIALRRESNNLVRAGYFEFFVSPGVRSLAISNASGAELLPVAVQYSASDVFELSEDQYAAMVTTSGGHDRVFPALAALLSGAEPASPETSDPRASRELVNHWEPLRRFVRSRYRQFVDSVAPRGSMEPTADWLDKADRLLEDGESYLAERLARYHYLYAEDPATRQRAFAILRGIASRHLDRESDDILNACLAMAMEPSPDNAVALGQVLREAGEDDLALMLALALPAGEPETRELRLACTFVKSWSYHFSAILREDPADPVSCLWRAHDLWRHGQRKAARREFARAGAEGAEWIAHLDATSEAREKVLRGDGSGLAEWAQAESTHPARKIWKEVSHEHVESFRAGVTMRALEREKYFHAFIAAPGEPLELNFASPRKLRIECRPIHPTDSTVPIEGWVTVDGPGGLHRKLPVITNYRSPGLEIADRPHEGAGTLVWDEFALDSWVTPIRIRPDFGPILVRVFSEEPEVRTCHLPPLGHEAAASLFDRKEAEPRRDAPDHDSGFGAVCVIDAEHTVQRRDLDPPFADPSSEMLARVRRIMSGLPRVPQAMTRQEQRAAIDRMTALLWTREHGGAEEQRRSIAAACAELEHHRTVSELSRIHSRIMRRTFWEPLLAADAGAGLREIESEGWRPEDPDLLGRMRLLSTLGSHEQLISGTDSTVALLANKEENIVRLRLAMELVPCLLPQPMRARVLLGDEPPREVVLSDRQQINEFEFHLPAGKISLRIEVLDSEPNHFLKVHLDADRESELYVRKTRRDYFIANADEPLVARIDGPSWVRIDRLDGGTTRSDYRFVKEAVETVTFAPTAAEGDALYRIHVLRIDEGKPFHPPAFTERPVETVPPPLAPLPLRERASLMEYDDEFHLGAQEDGTWTLGLSHHSRRALEEDSFAGRDPERFWQADLTHRYYDEALRTYFRTTVLLRLHEFGDETYGLEHSLQHRPYDSLLTHTLTGRAYWQDGDWALSALGSISATQHWTPKWSHTPSLSLFFRELSRSDSSPHQEPVDRDVFTSFESDHGRGLRLRDEVAYTPWRDTRFFAGAGIGTNENFNVFSPDSFSYWIGVDQLLGPVQVNASLKGYRFFEDEDRANASWQHRLNLEATGDFWLPNQDRLEFGVNWTSFIEQDEDAFFLFARWHFGEGRMFRDFRPGEEPFLSSRDHRIPQDRNNAIRPRNEPGYRAGK